MAIVNSNNRGFSLLEVMIALAVTAIALTTLLSLANRSIAAHDYQQNLTRGTFLAQQKMTEVETLYRLGRPSEIGIDGDFTEPFSRFRWQIVMQETMLPVVQQVTVTVLWGARENIDFIALDSFVFLGRDLTQ